MASRSKQRAVDGSQKSVETAESFADGLTSSDALSAAGFDAPDGVPSGWPNWNKIHLSESAQLRRAAIAVTASDGEHAAWETSRWTMNFIQDEQCAILRDIFANPFHPVTLDPAWRSPTVV